MYGITVHVKWSGGDPRRRKRTVTSFRPSLERSEGCCAGGTIRRNQRQERRFWIGMLTNQEIFDEAELYLLSFPDITQDVLDKQLAFPEQNRPKTKSDLFRNMIEHAQNRQGMPYAIGDIARLGPFLGHFDADAVNSEYQRWEDLFDAIKQQYTPPGRMERTNPRNFWVIFCKSILSIAQYVCRFNTIEDFNDYVNQFITSTPDTRLALPLILKEEIFGYQFALACDFVKENISPEFVKPDVHIKTIFIGIGKSPKGSTDYRIFRDVVLFAGSIGKAPYVVDKLFWLIGSGDFYRSRIKINTQRQLFIDRINHRRQSRQGASE